MMPANLFIGYLRLSIDDGDSEDHPDKLESNSITNQRQLIEGYLKDYPVQEAGDTYLELSDDGYSGTNFNRPQVRQLLTWVRQGKVKCIVVKDISRFGRDYIEVGNYLEQIFPFMGIRFISINDNYDSADYKGMTSGMDIAFRNLMNSLYSMDLSVKTLCARDMRIKKGYFTGGMPPFGYEFATPDKRRLKKDPVAAEHVSHIFELALTKGSTGEIARVLNQEGIPTPAVYKNSKRNIYPLEEKMQFWDTRKVRTILQNETYLGIVVNRKQRVTQVGAKKFVRVSDEERVYSKGQHEPIVTEELFQAAQKVFRKAGEQKHKRHKKDPKNILGGILYCPVCKKALTLSKGKKSGYYYCRRPLFDGSAECFHGKMYRDKIEVVVLKIANAQIELHGSPSSIPGKEMDNPQERIKKLEAEIHTLKNKKQGLHERYHSGILTREGFIIQREELIRKIKKKELELEGIMEASHPGEEIRNHTHPSGQTADLEVMPVLNKETLQTMIERIWVYDVDRIEIEWKSGIGFTGNRKRID